MFKLSKEIENILLIEQAIAINGEYNFKDDEDYIKILSDIHTDNFIKNSIRYDLIEGHFKDKQIKLNLRKYNMQFYIFNDNEFIGLIATYPNTISGYYNYFKKFHKYILSIKYMSMEDKYKNKGIMKYVVQTLLDSGYSLLTDTVEYEHVRRLWKSFSKIDNYQLDLLDLKNNIIKIEGIKLEDINDERVWELLTPENISKIMLNSIKYNNLLKKEFYRRLIIYNKEKHIPTIVNQK